MLKVTFCTYDKPGCVGGPFSWLQRLLPALAAQGMEIRCLVLLHYGETGSTLDALRAQGIACDAVGCHPQTADRVRWILERLALHPPDVFVPNLPASAYFAARWVRAAGIPTVGILHSDDLYYQAIQDEFVFGTKKFQLSALACVSRELQEQVLPRHPPSTAIWRMPYGVTIPKQTVVRSPGVLRLIYVGRLAKEQKRILEVGRAFCRVVKEVSQTTATLYGDGQDKDDLEALLLAEGRNLPVRLGGVLPNGLIQKAMLEADVIVLLSDYEGLPIALMEAMACGCVPVCMRMRSGIPELVEDGVTGLLVNDREADFEAAIQRLKEDPLLWARLSQAAKAKVASDFSDQSCDATWATRLTELGNAPQCRAALHIPRRPALPRRNPALESAADRLNPPSLPLRLWRRKRLLAGWIRRKLLG